MAPPLHPALAAIREAGAAQVKVACGDIDGVLRGKYLHRDKFEGAAEGGFGFCDVMFGRDCGDVAYDNALVTGRRHGFPDALARPDLGSHRLVPWDDNVDFLLGEFVNADGTPCPVCPRQTLKRGKPVFGVCRGLQLLNVAYGGTLYQDIQTQLPQALVHRDASVYDRNFHTISVLPDTRLAQLYPPTGPFKVNSIHHQAIKQLAPGFAAEAVSNEDGLVEAIRRVQLDQPFAAAVQWHPEFHLPDSDTLDAAALLEDFLAAARAARHRP